MKKLFSLMLVFGFCCVLAGCQGEIGSGNPNEIENAPEMTDDIPDDVDPYADMEAGGGGGDAGGGDAGGGN